MAEAAEVAMEVVVVVVVEDKDLNNLFALLNKIT